MLAVWRSVRADRAQHAGLVAGLADADVVAPEVLEDVAQLREPLPAREHADDGGLALVVRRRDDLLALPLAYPQQETFVLTAPREPRGARRRVVKDPIARLARPDPGALMHEPPRRSICPWYGPARARGSQATS